MMPLNTTTAPFASSRTRASIASSSSGCSEISAQLVMGSAAVHLGNEVVEQSVEYGKAVLHATGRTGQVDYEGIARHADKSAGERCGGSLLQALRPDRLGDTGDLAV